jgi:TetR/AcrR family transcriptional regulator
MADRQLSNAASERGAATERIRVRIRRAATRLFAERGFAGTSIQAVADEVGMSKQALMHHFPSKQHLREAAFSSFQQGLDELVPQLLLALTAGPDLVDQVLDQLIGFFERDPHWSRFLLRGLMEPGGEEADFGPSATAWIALALDYIRRAQADGLMRPDLDPEAAVPVLGLMIVSTFATIDHQPGTHLPVPCTLEEWQQRRLREVVRIVRTALLSPAAG